MNFFSINQSIYEENIPMNNRFLSEVSRIKEMMGILNEQNTPLSKITTTPIQKKFEPLIINFTQSFAPSKTEPMTITNEQKDKISNWLNQEGMDTVRVIANIESSSSKTWRSAAKNQEQATTMNVELSNKRFETAKNTIYNLIRTIKPNLELEIGGESKPNQGPEYKPGEDDVNDKKFREWQYVKLTLNVSGEGTTTESNRRDIPFYQVRQVFFDNNTQIGTKPQSMGLIEGCVSVKDEKGIFICEKYLPMYYANKLKGIKQTPEKLTQQMMTEGTVWVPYNQTTNGGWVGSDLYKGVNFWKDEKRRVCFGLINPPPNVDCSKVDLGPNYISKFNWDKNPPGDEISTWAIEELKKNLPELYNQTNPQQ